MTLARDMAAAFSTIAALLEDTAEWADDQLAGGASPKSVAYQLIDAGRLIARAARGDDPVSWPELMTSGSAAACTEETMPDMPPGYEWYAELAGDQMEGV